MSDPLRGDPVVLDVQLTARGASAQCGAWAAPDAATARIASWSGLALGAAACASDDPPALAVCVGKAVRRGTPTAARAAIVARSPLTGRLVDGSVGGDWARRFAAVADALFLRGKTALPGAVLCIDSQGQVELLAFPDQVGAALVNVHAALVERFGNCATLGVGPAGERDVRFANLATGVEPQSFVGRGGLGRALGQTGLKAVCVRASAVDGDAPGLLRDLLTASPSLEARALDGTFELTHEFALRGDLAPSGDDEHADASEWAASAAAERTKRHGCSGCPTPCGWVFQNSQGSEQLARFSATNALGTQLGLSAFADSRMLLERCNELGIDAKEAGACLALWQACARPAAQSREELAAVLSDLVHGVGEAARLAHGAAAFAAAIVFHYAWSYERITWLLGQ